jgi:hypothetical protein
MALASVARYDTRKKGHKASGNCGIFVSFLFFIFYFFLDRWHFGGKGNLDGKLEYSFKNYGMNRGLPLKENPITQELPETHRFPPRNDNQKVTLHMMELRRRLQLNS